MSWLEVAFELKSNQVSHGTELLERLGALAVTCYDAKDEPIFEPPPLSEPIVWEDSILVGLMEENCAIETIKAQLLKEFPRTQISAKSLEDKNWITFVQSKFPVQQYGNLWVCPSWETPPESEQAICMHLDPGMAFGTGTHATTHLCLDWISTASLNKKMIIDFGCGSGILGVATALLGAQRVFAIDHCEQALQATQENSLKNNISSEILSTHLPNDPIIQEIKADTLIANILAGPILTLKNTFISLLKPNGELILSGLLEDQIDQIMDDYRTHFTFEPPKVLDGWCCLYAHRRDLAS